MALAFFPPTMQGVAAPLGTKSLTSCSITFDAEKGKKQGPKEEKGRQLRLACPPFLSACVTASNGSPNVSSYDDVTLEVVSLTDSLP
eukprot:1152935-Pelagomonas_calceolata.AAC.5